MRRSHSLTSTTFLALLFLGCGGGSPPPRAESAEAHGSPGAAFALPPAPSASEDGATVPISMTDPTWGGRNALVSVVVFGDLECPYTGKILKTVQALEQKYGPSDLRVVWKDDPLPFHPHARAASLAAETVFALGHSDAFWKFWELTLTHQSELSDASYEGWAHGAGVDAATFRQALATGAAGAKIDRDRSVADRLHVSGTPTFFVNGVALVGAQPLEKLEALVDVELPKARARLAAGVLPEALYTDLARANWKAPVEAAEPEEKEDTTTVWGVAVGTAPVRGRSDALVTIVVFSDFQCPYCKRGEAVIDRVRETYGDKVRIAWKDEPLPFHPHAMPAAELAREARAEKGDAGFWAAHDAIFAAAPRLEDDDLVTLGKVLGLDAARVKTAIEAKRYAARIEDDLDEAEELHADGTPHFFINGRRLAGAQPFEAFKAIIDEEIRHAEALIAKGTPRHSVYEAIMKGAVVGDVRTVPPRATAPFKGPASAPVIIEEFADFQCPYCTRAEPALAEVAAKYGSRVKLVWRNLPLPFHKHAALAAEAAAEAQHQKGDVGFWAMHDKLFAHQADHDGDGSGLERPALDAYARELGLDVVAFDRALDAHVHKAEIEEDTRAAEAAQINGTPAFVVGGYLVTGAQPFARFQRLIEHVLASGPGRPSGK